MKAIIRDDIIKLESYVEAEFKYKKFIEIIAGCGGYCFLEQIERIWKSEGGKYLARKMEDAKLIKTDNFSRFKFVRLTSTALKYLYYRDDERDFSGIPKNKISIKNLRKKPSEKVLFTSVINFELYHKKMPYFSKKRHLEMLIGEFSFSYSEAIEESKCEINKLTNRNRELEVVKSFFENTLVSEGYNIKKLTDLSDEFEEEVSRLNNKKNIIKKYEKEIEQAKHWEQEVLKVLSTSNYTSLAIIKIEGEQDELLLSYNQLLNRVSNLEKAQLIINKRKDDIIKEFMQLRDISKIVCKYDKELMKLTVVSTSIKHSRGEYPKLLRSIAKSIYKSGFYVKEIHLVIASIYELNDKTTEAIKRSVVTEGSAYKWDDLYDKSIFDPLIPRDDSYIKWRDGVMCDIILNNIKRSIQFYTLHELQKYFDTISDTINYVKKDHIQQFEELKGKLSKK